MSPQEVKKAYGATHYAVMRDGVTPQMYYKKELQNFSDGTKALRWVYLSFAGIWMGSALNDRDAPLVNDLKEIT